MKTLFALIVACTGMFSVGTLAQGVGAEYWITIEKGKDDQPILKIGMKDFESGCHLALQSDVAKWERVTSYHLVCATDTQRDDTLDDIAALGGWDALFKKIKESLYLEAP